MIKKILIANRGEIAVRIIRACKEMKISTVAIYSTADEKSLHKELADEAVCVGEANSRDSYLNMENILAAACSTGCDAIHPGCGFLSESPQFARMVEKCGLIWIGPNADVMEKMGNKSVAISTMLDANVPVVPGSHGAVDIKRAKEIAVEIGFPVLIKASAGGGGKGIRLVENESSFDELYNEAKEEALKFFSNDELYVEKFVKDPKHIEVQVLCDKHGHTLHLFERNCSLQRRKQKMLEESPCQCISQNLKDKLYASAVKAASSIGYDSVGTVEFIVDNDENYYFIEMNTRIQVEHCVTEQVTGIDLIKSMIKVADNQPLRIKQSDIKCLCYAMECRINAEDVKNEFRPNPGQITFLHMPGGKGIRIDSAIYSGYTIQPFYDSMIMKVIVNAESRLECIRKMRAVLEELIIEGVKTTVEYHYMILHHPTFILGNYNTGFTDVFLKEIEQNGRKSI